MPVKRVQLDGRTYLLMRERGGPNEPRLEPRQCGIELVDVETHELRRVELQRAVGLVEVPSPHVNRPLYDIWPLVPFVKFDERPRDFLLDIRAKRQQLRRDAKRVRKGQELGELTGSDTEGRIEKTPKPRKPRATKPEGSTRRPTKRVADVVASKEAELMAILQARLKAEGK